MQDSDMLPPKQWLETSINSQITLFTRKKKKFTGTLLGIDDHFNLLMDNVVESDGDSTIEMGRTLINGGMVTLIEFVS